MALLTVQKISQSGVVPAYAAASAETDSFVNDGKTILFVKNNGGFSVSAQISVQTGCNFGHLHELNFTVSAGATSVFGPFETQRFNTNESKVTWIYLADSSSTQLLAISI